MTTTVDASDRRIARVERVLDLGVLALGIAILLLAPGARVTLHPPSLVVAAGIALLGAGLLRDLAWLALQGRPAALEPTTRLLLAGPRNQAARPGRSASSRGFAAASAGGFGGVFRDPFDIHRNMPFWS